MKDRYSYVIHFKSEAHLLSLPNSFIRLLAGFSYFEVVGLKLFSVPCQVSLVKRQLTVWQVAPCRQGAWESTRGSFCKLTWKAHSIVLSIINSSEGESQRRAGCSNHILREVIVEKHLCQEVVSLKAIFKDVKDKHNVKHKTHFLLIREWPEKTKWKLLKYLEKATK